MQDPSRPLHLLIAGPPGSGKGTQCRLLVDAYKNISHISTGDMLRAERNSGTLLGQYVDEVWSIKGLEEIAIEMIINSATAAVEEGRGFVIDGMPRTIESAKMMLSTFQERDIKLEGIVEFLFSADAAVRRLEGRRVDLATGEVYHVDLKPPTAGEEAKARITRREDDDADAIRGRYRTYEKNDEVRRFFREDPASGLPPYVQLDVENKTIEEVFAELQQHLPKFLPPSSSGAADAAGSKQQPAQRPPKEWKDGDKVGAIETARVRQQVKILSASRQPPSRFPGVHPINLGKANIDVLCDREYRFARKIDGERRLLVLMDNTCYTVDRKMDAMVYPSIRFHPRWNRTLLDGELVTPRDAAAELHFVVFDTLTVSGDSVMRDHLPDRLAAAEPVLQAIEEATGAERMPFSLKMQKYFMLYELAQQIQEPETKEGRAAEAKQHRREVENVYHVDGLIFSPVTMPYRLGWCREITKWKNARNDTIDFRIVKGQPQQPWGLYVRGNPSELLYDRIDLSQEDIDKYQLQDNDVVECYWESADSEVSEVRSARGRWRVARKRTDKSAPNADWVVEGIEANLKDPLEMDDLVSYVATLPPEGFRERGGRGRGGGRGGYHRGGYDRDRNRDDGDRRYDGYERRQGDRGAYGHNSRCDDRRREDRPSPSSSEKRGEDSWRKRPTASNEARAAPVSPAPKASGGQAPSANRWEKPPQLGQTGGAAAPTPSKPKESEPRRVLDATSSPSREDTLADDGWSTVPSRGRDARASRPTAEKRPRQEDSDESWRRPGGGGRKAPYGANSQRRDDSSSSSSSGWSRGGSRAGGNNAARGQRK